MHNKADPGGETKFGISKRSYPGVDIANLTKQQASDIYYRDWWIPLQLDQIQDDAIAVKILDTCVNVGSRAGVKILQKALRNVGEGVEVDGIIGRQTIAAANRADADDLLRHMQRLQAEYYQRLIQRNPKLKQFERGWINRAYS